MTGLVQDIRVACRSLLRAPAFSVASIVTLALGIGAVTTIFTVVNAALLRPLPYPEPDRMVALVVGTPNASYHGARDYLYLRDRVSTFDAIAAYGFGTGWNLSTADEAEYVAAMPVSAGFFEALGVAPLAGRGFTEAEDRPNGPGAAIISEDLWQRTFAGRRDAVGEIVSLGGTPHEIVGVVPALSGPIRGVDVWTPLRATSGDSGTNERIVARLAPDASLTQANAELDTLRAGLLAQPRYGEERAAALRWIAYRDMVGANARTPLLILLGAVGLLLLIACLNVASLQTARALQQRREMATRAALGASRGVLVRRALAEAGVLAVLGAAAGLGISMLGIRLLSRVTPLGLFDELTAGQPTSPDWRVALAIVACSAVACLLFGAFPAAIASGARVRATTGGSNRSTPSRSGVWLRRAFTTAQVALAVVLLVAAGLFARTMATMASVDPGFDPSGVVVATMSLRGDAVADADRLSTLLERGVAGLSAIPRVASVAASNAVPVEAGINLPLEPPAGALIETRRSVDWRYVSPAYFETFQVPLVAGRMFDAGDALGGAPVAIVNQAFARTYFGGANVLGRRLQLVPTFDDPPREIVGVVADVRSRSNAGWVRGLAARAMPPSPTLFVPAAQAPATAMRAAHGFFPMTWILRTEGTAPDLERDARATMAAVDPTLPFIQFRSMDAVLANDAAFHRFFTILIGLFSSIAIILAAVGLYGLIAYTVSQRTQETGIRLALGATAGRVLRSFMAEGVALAAAGIVVGLAGATLLTQAVEFLLFGVSPLDPFTFAAVALLLGAVTIIATLLPAARAARTDPSDALRAE